jgi:PAS domain S-box-containing protein
MSDHSEHEIRLAYPVLPGRFNPTQNLSAGPVTRKIRRAESALQQRVDFEALVSRISSFFVTLKSEDLDWGILEALREIATFVGVDHAHVFSIRDGTYLDHTHEWSYDREVSAMSSLKNQLLDEYLPWASKKLRVLDGLAVGSVNGMAREARADQMVFQQMGLKSVILIPMAAQGELVGIMGFDSERMEVEWTQDAIALLGIMGVIISDALQRKATEDALRMEALFSNAVLNSSGTLCVVLNVSAQIVRFNSSAEEVTGYWAEEVYGRSPWDLFVPREEHAAFRRVFRRVASGVKNDRHEGSILTKSGDRITLSWLITSIRDGEEVQYVILSGLDITERRRLEAEVLDVAEQEQSRFGHDLHDGLGQHLTGIQYMTTVLEHKLNAEGHPLAKQASEISSLVRDAISQTRELARGLSPVVLQDKGIGVALQELAAMVRNRTGMKAACMVGLDCEIERLETATHLYRIAQEAVNNSMKHARASQIRISLQRVHELYELRVEDDGLSFQPSEKAGIGMRVMNYRAGILGGSLEITRNAQGGASVVCRCP